MRILQINNCHYRRGGADIVYLNTGKLLEEHGHMVCYFSQENIKNEETKFSNYFIKEADFFGKSFIQKIYSIPRFFYSFEAKNSISKLLNDFKPEVAHIHLYKGILTPSILKKLKEHKIPVIITLHDYGLLCPHNLMLDGKMNICKRCINASALNCVFHKCNRNSLILSTVSSIEFIFHKTFFPFLKYFDKIIAVSKFGTEIHQESNEFKDKIDFLYNFYPELDKTKINSKKGSYFLYLGRLSAEKGINTLITAWVSKERESKLKVVGTGELFVELNDLTTKNDSIELLGFKTGIELINLIKNASFIIVPSEWYENNPLTIIEAFSNGKPVIGSNVGGIPELIINNKTGFVFTTKNTSELSDIITTAEKMDDKTYSDFSFRCRKFAEDNFSDKNHYNNLIDIYTKVINDNK